MVSNQGPTCSEALTLLHTESLFSQFTLNGQLPSKVYKQYCLKVKHHLLLTFKKNEQEYDFLGPCVNCKLWIIKVAVKNVEARE